jgi:hypothetical protein
MRALRHELANKLLLKSFTIRGPLQRQLPTLNGQFDVVKSVGETKSQLRLRAARCPGMGPPEARGLYTAYVSMNELVLASRPSSYFIMGQGESEFRGRIAQSYWQAERRSG